MNAVALLFVVGGVTWEAVRRLQQPEPVAGGLVIVVASIGVIVNGVSAALFVSGSREDINLRGAFLHLASDAAVSVGVALAGVAILITGWLWLDPAVSIAIGLVILVGTWGLLRSSLNLAMDAVPDHIDPAAVAAYLASVPCVIDVHDLHIWGMSTTETALTAHLVVGRRTTGDAAVDDALLASVRDVLEDRFGIRHATIQLEQGNPAYPCELAPATVV
jgi:cobalt-zinc-cadmium efflux system protein